MKKKIQKLVGAVSALAFISLPFLSYSAPDPTVNSVRISQGGITISNKEIQGKNTFLPIISDRDVEFKISLGACWDGEDYAVMVDNKINNKISVMHGTAPYKNTCSDWLQGAGAKPVEYTLFHDRKFNGQSIYITYGGVPTPYTQKMELRVYEDSYREKSPSSLNNKFKGHVMLKSEDQGQAYYISPISKKAYYLITPKVAFQIIKGLSLGISNENLKKFPVGGTCADQTMACDMPAKYDKKFADKYRGYIFLQAENAGELWYISPKDGKRYFLGKPEEAYNLITEQATGISNLNFKKMELAY